MNATPAATTVPPIILPYRGKLPKFGRDIFIAPGAAVIGDVELGDEVNVWFGCVIRGDDHQVRIGARTCVQDGAVIHVTLNRWPTIVGANVTLAHGVRLHGCTIEDSAMIGISATVLDGAHVESGAVVAAGAVVSPGKRVKAGEMWAGCPARFVRPVKDEERGFIDFNGPHYAGLAREYLKMGIGKP